ncbi:hypothetical protein VPH35_138075 [Triticum aestivum]
MDFLVAWLHVASDLVLPPSLSLSLFVCVCVWARARSSRSLIADCRLIAPMAVASVPYRYSTASHRCCIALDSVVASAGTVRCCLMPWSKRVWSADARYAMLLSLGTLCSKRCECWA